MEATAIVFEKPGTLQVKRLGLATPGDSDVVVETLLSGVSTGTEKMLFDGTMPPFPGMTYPLVPGYESVGRIVKAGPASGRKPGDMVFVPGAACYTDAAGLFGASADTLIIPGARAVLIDETLADDAVLLALAATAHHALVRAESPVDQIIGHGVLGQLIARLACALGQNPPQVLETSAARRSGAAGYDVLDPESDQVARRCGTIIDASGNPSAIDPAIGRLAKGGTLVLAGFYGGSVGFNFPAAFMREATLSLSAEFNHDDVRAVLDLVSSGQLSLSGLITHHAPPSDAPQAYKTAFEDPACLKMVIDWRTAA